MYTASQCQLTRCIWLFLQSLSLSDEETHDTKQLAEILSVISECKDDSQQRSWQLHDDEGFIHDKLSKLLNIMVCAVIAGCCLGASLICTTLWSIGCWEFFRKWLWIKLFRLGRNDLKILIGARRSIGSWPGCIFNSPLTRLTDLLWLVPRNQHFSIIQLTGNKDSVCRTISKDEDNLHNLVLYYQMETRNSLRLLMLQIFSAACSMSAKFISSLLFSVLPLELVRDLMSTCGECYSVSKTVSKMASWVWNVQQVYLIMP